MAGDEDDDLVWQLETALAIRGLPVLVHEQTAAHHCPIQIERRTVTDSTDTPLPLLTTFLSSSILRPEDPETGRPLETLRHALKLRLLSVRTRDGGFFFRDHLEQTEDWQDILVVDIVPAAVAGELPGRLGDLEQHDPARHPHLGAASRGSAAKTSPPTCPTSGAAPFRCPDGPAAARRARGGPGHGHPARARQLSGRLGLSRRNAVKVGKSASYRPANTGSSDAYVAAADGFGRTVFLEPYKIIREVDGRDQAQRLHAEQRGSEAGALVPLGELDLHPENVREHLPPQRASDEAAGRPDLARPRDQLLASTCSTSASCMQTPFERGPDQVLPAVRPGQADVRASGQRVPVRRSLAEQVRAA